jgi:hypothetical protein
VLERLEQLRDDQLVYRLPKADGSTQLRLTPLELIERRAALIPSLCLHRHCTSIPRPARSCFALLASHPRRSTYLSWRSKWQLSGLGFQLLNVAEWPMAAIARRMALVSDAA